MGRVTITLDERDHLALKLLALQPPLPGKMTPLHFDHQGGLDGAELCVATARPSKLM